MAALYNEVVSSEQRRLNLEQFLGHCCDEATGSVIGVHPNEDGLECVSKVLRWEGEHWLLGGGLWDDEHDAVHSLLLESLFPILSLAGSENHSL